MSVRSLALQSIQYRTPPAAVERAARSVVAAAETLRRQRPELEEVSWRIGDCSPEPVLDAAAVAGLRAQLGAAGVRLEHRVFGANHGPSRGHNLLWDEQGPADALFLMAPDLVLAPDALLELLRLLDDPAVGGVEARQIPPLHPPHRGSYDVPAPWIGGACSMLRGSAFSAVGGYDADTFFLYHNDVDLSWRLRDAAWTLRAAAHAVVFHDKRPDRDGRFVVGPAARQAATLGWLSCLHVWGRQEAVATLRARIEAAAAGADNAADAAAADAAADRAALAEFDARLAAGSLRAPRRSAVIDAGLREHPLGGLS